MMRRDYERAIIARPALKVTLRGSNGQSSTGMLERHTEVNDKKYTSTMIACNTQLLKRRIVLITQSGVEKQVDRSLPECLN